MLCLKWHDEAIHLLFFSLDSDPASNMPAQCYVQSRMAKLASDDSQSLDSVLQLLSQLSVYFVSHSSSSAVNYKPYFNNTSGNSTSVQQLILISFRMTASQGLSLHFRLFIDRFVL